MSPRAGAAAIDPAVVWHDTECGAYDADLALWEELAADRGGPVLELGAGTGRVALHLARRGHRVVAVEREGPLAAELARRAAAARLPVEALAADARALALGRRFPVILAPMQFLQLFLAPVERGAVLAACRAHLAPGGIVAAALIDGVPSSALPPGAADSEPLPDLREAEGFVYASLPLGVAVQGDVLESPRLRQRVAPDGGIETERHVDRLALLPVAALEAEARAAGLEPTGRVAIPATDSHVESTVSILVAAR